MGNGKPSPRRRRLLELAVQRQLVGDVPVGVFLSGGVDSSAIAAFASRHYEGKLATYCAGFDFAKGEGELPRARRVAQAFGTDHHEIHIRGGDVGQLVEKLVHHHDMPFADAANIPLYLMAAQISPHTKVVLQGDGGDELFGGYSRYFTLGQYWLLRPAARLLQHLQALTPQSAFHYRARRYLRAVGAEDMATAVALLLTPEDRSLRPTSVFAAASAERGGENRSVRASSRLPAGVRGRRSGEPDVVRRSGHHAAGHLPREGRPLDDGGEPGSARAVPGSRAGGFRGSPAGLRQGAGRPSQVAAEAGASGHRAGRSADRSQGGARSAVRRVAAGPAAPICSSTIWSVSSACTPVCWTWRA